MGYVRYQKVCEVCGVGFEAPMMKSRACQENCKKVIRKTSDAVKIYRENKILKSVKDSLEKYPDGTDQRKFVTCGICGLRATRLNNAHLKMHNITFKEYEELYGAWCSEIYIESVQGENNPGFNHGGKFQPFSKNFVKYTSDADIQERFDRATQTRQDNNQINTRLSFYTAQGYSEEDAQKLLSERQSTFSLEKCIAELGFDKGTIRWLERQETWQNTLNAKSDQEKAEINKKKSNNVSFRELWTGPIGDNGWLYIVKIADRDYKIGITTRGSIIARYKFMGKLSDPRYSNRFVPDVILFQKMENITHAFMVEQMTKVNFTDRFNNSAHEWCPEFGWTEIVRDIDYSELFEFVEPYIGDFAQIDKIFREKYPKFKY